MRCTSSWALVALLAACSIEEVDTEVSRSPIIGGSQATAGKWPDAVALIRGGQQECTGTLIAPTVVLTASHCIEGFGGGVDLPEQVKLGTTSLRSAEGELLQVTGGFQYPNAWNTVDAAVLVLGRASAIKPRPIASGWARFDIVNGANITLAGYGTIDRDGSVGTDNLMEARSTITDHDCTTSSGCNTGARPDGELGAGGMGVDTCPGDSGGPLYLHTSYGEFVAGITSRGYDTAQYACSEGGIYGRADKVVDWIEMVTGLSVSRGPTPKAEPIVVVRGHGGETKIEHNDPKSDSHTFEITTPPQYGTAAVRSDGLARVCPRTDVAGDDSFVVTVTDKSDSARSLAVKIAVTIQDGDPADDCDPTDFGEDGGCCDTRRGAGGSIPFALFVLAALLRRRRAR